MQTGIKAQAVEDPDQVSQFGVVELNLQVADPGLTTPQHQKMLTNTSRGNPNGFRRRTKGAGHPTHQITGVGQHPIDQGHQVIQPSLQLGSTSPIEGPTGDDSQGISGMASRNIWKAFQFQAAALLPVDKGLFHGAFLSGHHIHQASPQPLKAAGTSTKGQGLNQGKPLAMAAHGIEKGLDAAASGIHALA
jgi:hypothetical protein